MKTDTNPNKLEILLSRGVEEIVDRSNLAKKLAAGEQLRVKFGIDPTAADLHLGHAVGLRKLAQFQDLGHIIVLIIGDFTTLIGDPSGRTAARPALTVAQIRDNMKDYIAQASKIIDVKKAEIHYNSEWFEKKPMSFLMDLAGRFTIARLIEREDFQKRLQGGFDVSMLEMLYPLLQGYDSVACRADVELGGYDQRLNLLFGRKVQKKFDLPEQDVVTVPLLIGTDGEKKMSKSVGNYIRICENADKMYSQLMLVADSQICEYLVLLTDVESESVKTMESEIKTGKIHPRDAKMIMASEIVALFCGKEAAKTAQREFVRVSQEGLLPANIAEVNVGDKEIGLLNLLVAAGAAPSTSEAKRLVEQKSVLIDDVVCGNWKEKFTPKDGQIIKIGKKKFYKIKKQKSAD